MRGGKKLSVEEEEKDMKYESIFIYFNNNLFAFHSARRNKQKKTAAILRLSHALAYLDGNFSARNCENVIDNICTLRRVFETSAVKQLLFEDGKILNQTSWEVTAVERKKIKVQTKDKSDVKTDWSSFLCTIKTIITSNKKNCLRWNL